MSGERAPTGAGGPIAFLVPGDIGQFSGGYGYARAVLAAWEAAGVAAEAVRLPDDYPFPSERSLRETADVVAALPADRPVLIDGLAYGTMPADMIAHCKAPIIVLLHHPLGLETGLDDGESTRLLASEKQAVAMAAHVVVTSAETGRTVERLFGVDPTNITVALPGTEKHPRARRDGQPPSIISIASLTPRKGHRDLVAALAQIADLEWRAIFAGSLKAAPDTVAEMRRAIDAAGLAERISLPGPVADKALEAVYGDASIFALASHYEGYGMAFAEALSFGLPIVGYRAGAVPDVVPEAAGTLVTPGDIGGLAAALRRLLSEPDHADQMAAAAYEAGEALPGWDETARRIHDVLARETRP